MKKPLSERCDTLREDVRHIRGERSSHAAQVDATFREIFKKETELHKKFADKWIALAASDIEMCKKFVYKHQTVSQTTSADVVDPIVVDESGSEEAAHAEHRRTPPPAAEAYYEPWVVDD